MAISSQMAKRRKTGPDVRRMARESAVVRTQEHHGGWLLRGSLRQKNGRRSRNSAPHPRDIRPRGRRSSGIDFPVPGNVGFRRLRLPVDDVHRGVTGNTNLFGRGSSGAKKFAAPSTTSAMPSTNARSPLVVNPRPNFQKWLSHRCRIGNYTRKMGAGRARLYEDRPAILTITRGHYDGEQPGAMEYSGRT